MNRNEHLAWCKRRALEYVQQNDLTNAWASFASDMNKHLGTADHIGLSLGAHLFYAGLLNSPEKMREHIEGCN